MFIPPRRDLSTNWALSRARANLASELAVRPRRDASINCFALSPSFAAKWHRLFCCGVALAASGCYHEWTMCTSQGPYLSSGCFSTGPRCTLQDMKQGVRWYSCRGSLVKAMFDVAHFLLQEHGVSENKHVKRMCTPNMQTALWPLAPVMLHVCIYMYRYIFLPLCLARMALVGDEG